MTAPSTSVIIPAYRARHTIERVMLALEDQIVGRGRELIVVESGGDGSAAEFEARWPWARVAARTERLLPGAARNLGVSLAGGRMLAFLDADAVPRRDWLDELERTLAPGVEMVAGAVLNGTPDSRWGTAAYLLEFLDWAPDRGQAPWHAAGCNLLVSRELLERAGGFPEDLWPGEDTVLSAQFGRRGTLAFAREAQVMHLNRSDRRSVLAHQRRLGAAWVAVCERAEIPGSWLADPRIAPLAGAGRVLSVARALRSSPSAGRRALGQVPRLLAGIAAWSLGVAQYSTTRRRTNT